MKAILLGKDAGGQLVQLTPEMRQRTHMHVIGGSGTGKSKFLEWLIRKDIREGHGFCLIDWHGSLYNDVLRYCAHLDIGLCGDFRQVILLNPSQPEFITGFNPFMNPGEDVSTQVSKRIDATIKPWGASNTNETPTFARIARVLYTFMAESRQTLPNAASLLEFERRELREHAIRQVSDAWVKAQWRSLQAVRTEREWREQVLSTDNRLARFIGSRGVRRFMGLAHNNLDLVDIMDSGKILLINLGASGFLDREAARVFASLFLSEFFDAAMLRANRNLAGGEKPRHYLLYLDEFQQYITDDIAAMLDEVRKGGLHVVLAHQHLGHFVDNPKLLKSVLTNARLRAVFGGLDFADACLLANEMFLPDLNTRQIKKAYYHTIHLYREETRTVRSRSTARGSSSTHGTSAGSGSAYSTGTVASSSSGVSGPITGIGLLSTEGWFSKTRGTSDSSSTAASDFSSSSDAYTESESEGFGEAEVPVWVPIPVQELGSEAEWSLEEKRSKVAELLKCQQQAHCFIKLDTETTQPLRVPFVKEYGLPKESLLHYQREVYKAQGALPAAEVDRLIEAGRQQFLAATRATIEVIPEEDTESLFEPEPAPKPKASRKKTASAIWTRGAPTEPPGKK